MRAPVHGRRGHQRFSVPNSDGVLSVLREVSVRQTADGEILVVDREPRNPDEVLTLEMMVNGTPAVTRVRVVASSPIVRNGRVLHELRLARLSEPDPGVESR